MRRFNLTHILVTGGTGVLGRALVSRLHQAGHVVRIMSRRARPADLPAGLEWAQAELETGRGLAEAVSGVQVIVHTASDPRRRDGQIDVEGTRRLWEQAGSARVAHLVYISIVGIDRIPFFYYQHKLAAEEILAGGSVPWSILRATQFHDLLDGFLQRVMRYPLVLGPTDYQFQPVDSGEAADRLVECVAAGPAGRLTDMGGPEVLRSGELARIWLGARRLRRLIVHLPSPGKVAHGFREGYNTCPQNRQGKVTWQAWLKRKYSGEGC
jgi:uncharacterized protein YbjT (DUF2867 family)